MGGRGGERVSDTEEERRERETVEGEREREGGGWKERGGGRE